jgi:aldose 1-epimerase
VSDTDRVKHRKITGIATSSSAQSMVAGELEAMFLPSHGMIGVSLRHQGVELLRRIENIDTLAAEGSAAGIPLLHPWANRLAEHRYHAAGREVVLDKTSPLLRHDEQGLPIHGVPWSMLDWSLIETAQDRIVAQLAWNQPERLAIFPYPHQLEMVVLLEPEGLTIETTLTAGKDAAVPVSFGFHPYFGLPSLPRSKWRLTLPAMRKLVLDHYGIPTGSEEPINGIDAQLGEHDIDNGAMLLEESSSLSLTGGGRKISLELLKGYQYVQVFAPRSQDYIAMEPMTAPTNALKSGIGLTIVEPGARYQAAFRICVETCGR